MKVNNKVKQEINVSNSQPEPKYDASTIAKYLLSLDENREYFSNKVVKNEITSASIIVGNFRLNQTLYILQISYYQKCGKSLFKDELYAWEHGTVIYKVYTHFWSLYFSKNNQNTQDIDEETKEFISKRLDYLRNIPDIILKEISYTDPVWSSTWLKGTKPNIDFTNEENQKMYQRFYSRWLQEIGT